MYRIAICDDENQFNITMEKMILEYARKKGISVNVRRFLKAEEFFDAVHDEGMFDIIFLDIELEGETGIEVGQRIRKNIKNETVQIIYVSSKSDYALQLFDIRPMNFLVKPVSYERVTYVLDEYERLFGFSLRFFTYKKGRREYKVNEDCIVYFQSTGKKIEMVMTDGRDEFYGKISDVVSRLNGRTFCEVHKSFVINRRYVERYIKGNIIMTNGVDIPVSRSMQQKVLREIGEDFWK